MRKSGFTLMELMVYIAIVGIVVLVAGQAFSDSTKFRVRTQNMLKAGEIASTAGTLVQEDVSQMGAKSYVEKNSDGTFKKFEVANDIYMPVPEGSTEDDKTSFSLNRVVSDGKRMDNLVIRRVRYNSAGEWTATEEISWYGKDQNLYRSCKVVRGAESEECKADEAGSTVMVAEGVKQFKVMPGVPSDINSSSQIFPRADGVNFGFVSRFATSEMKDGRSIAYSRVIMEGDEDLQGKVGTMATLYGFDSNYDFDKEALPTGADRTISQVYATDETGKTQWTDCTVMDFKTNNEYMIKFMIGYNEASRSIFVPGRDHAAVGIRKTDGSSAGVEDFLIFPPEDESGGLISQKLYFVPKENVSACLAFTFASFAPQGRDARVTVSELSVHKVRNFNYQYDESATGSVEINAKKLVKAFKVEIEVEKNKELAKTSLIVPVPSSGAEGAL
ncbi:MAG: prepilin-type N-terminal cleavage/methylation domain-containing protein [Fibrobacteraceae bacterium]|nr:prepilin-type N-terminal cleavage/methylation domain-containing protein [Fibrobacteraceae bacterium]